MLSEPSLRRLYLLIDKAITKIRDAISAAGEAAADAINEHAKATGQAAKQQTPLPSRMAVDVNVPREEIDRYSAKRNKPNSLQWWAFSVNVLTLFAVAGYALLTYFQWHTTNDTLCEIRRQTGYTKQAADAATSAAKTAAEALIESTKSFQTEERPYLITNGPIFLGGPTAEREIRANITIKNIGKTPATEISTELTLKAPRLSKTSRRAYIRFINSIFAELRSKTTVVREEIKQKRAEHDIAPGGEFFATNQDPIVISAKDFPLTETGEITLMYTGIVSYTDAFKGDYTTEFCYQYFGTDPKIWHICDSHNSIK